MTRIPIFIFLCLLAIGIARCNSSDTHTEENEPQLPAEAVEKAFLIKYPAASAITWKGEGNFQRAKFIFNNANYETWFNLSGIWLQAEHETTYTALPEIVKELIANNINYPPNAWIPDKSVEILERKDELLWYGIELKNGTQDVTIWSDQNAYRSKVVISDSDGDDIPAAINNLLKTKYNQGIVTELWKMENDTYEIGLLDGNTVKQIHFDRSMNWFYTEWPIAWPDVPAAVKTTLSGTAYHDYSVRMTTYQQYSDIEYYHIVLQPKSGTGSDTNVNIDSNGHLVL